MTGTFEQSTSCLRDEIFDDTICISKDAAVLKIQHNWTYLEDVILLCMAVLGSITAPLCVMWGGSWREIGLAPSLWLLVVDTVIDMVYLIVLLRRFDTSKGSVETSQYKRFHRLIRTSSAFPLLLSTTVCHAVALAVSLPSLMCLKIVRLYHLSYLPASFQKLEDSWLYRVARPSLFLFMGSNALGCYFTLSGSYIERLQDPAFQTYVFDTPVRPAVSVYFLACTEAFLLLTGSLDNPLGEGSSIRNRQFWPLLTILIVMPFGSIIAAMFLSVIIREHNKRNALYARQEEKRAFISKALVTLNIPSTLRRRVFNLIRYNEMHQDYIALKTLFDRRNVSAPLEFALRLHLYQESVLTSPYFVRKNSSYVLEVIRALEDNTYVPGDYVVRRGELGEEMFFVGRGTLVVMVPSIQGKGEHTNSVDHAIRVSSMKSGDFFGEVALIRKCTRTAWVMTETYSILSVLRSKNMDMLWTHFPEYKGELQRAVEAAARRDKHRQAAALARSEPSSEESAVEVEDVSTDLPPGGNTSSSLERLIKLLSQLIESQKQQERRTAETFQRQMALEEKIAELTARNAQLAATNSYRPSDEASRENGCAHKTLNGSHAKRQPRRHRVRIDME